MFLLTYCLWNYVILVYISPFIRELYNIELKIFHGKSLLLFISGYITLWSDNVIFIITILWNLCGFSYDLMYSQFLWIVLKKVYTVLFGCQVWYVSRRSIFKKSYCDKIYIT